MLNLWDIFEWLFLVTPRKITGPSRDLIQQIEEAQRDGRLVTVISLVDRLTKLLSREERAEAQAECALIINEMGDPTKALELLDQARKGYIGDDHRLAVIAWLNGIILRQIPHRRDEVLSQWLKAIQLFEQIVTNRYHPAKRVDPLWHQDRIPEMREALRDAINTEII